MKGIFKNLLRVSQVAGRGGPLVGTAAQLRVFFYMSHPYVSFDNLQSGLWLIILFQKLLNYVCVASLRFGPYQGPSSPPFWCRYWAKGQGQPL